MKNYTDIEQSKKLAEILPIESADMYYGVLDIYHANTLYDSCDIEYFNSREYIPCWSLAALINALPQKVIRLVGSSKEAFWYCDYVDSNDNELHTGKSADTPIDACYNLILSLNKLRIL